MIERRKVRFMEVSPLPYRREVVAWSFGQVETEFLRPKKAYSGYDTLLKVAEWALTAQICCVLDFAIPEYCSSLKSLLVCLYFQIDSSEIAGWRQNGSPYPGSPVEAVKIENSICMIPCLNAVSFMTGLLEGTFRRNNDWGDATTEHNGIFYLWFF